MQLLKICKQIVKLAKAQISKILQLGEYFGSCLVNLGGKKALINVAVPLTRENFPGLVSNLTSSEEGAVRWGKGFTLLISNEDMNGNIKIIKSLEDSAVLSNGIIETVKDETKNKNVDHLELY